MKNSGKAQFAAGDAVIVGGCRATVVYELQAICDEARAYRVRVFNGCGPDMFESALEQDMRARS